MTLAGIKMKIVGRDGTPLKGRDGTDTSYWTSTIAAHVGASYEAIFTAPPFQGPGIPDPEIGANYNAYLLYNRNYHMSNNLEPNGFGGQRPKCASTRPVSCRPRPCQTRRQGEYQCTQKCVSESGSLSMAMVMVLLVSLAVGFAPQPTAAQMPACPWTAWSAPWAAGI